MSKYDKQFKQSVVDSYLRGADGGYEAVAQLFGIDHSMVRRWVKFFQAHGAGGLDKKFSHYSALFKLSVLQHYWSQSHSIQATAAVFNVRNPAILAEWERRYHLGGIDALHPRPRGRPKKMATPPDPKPPAPPDDGSRTREELLAELNYLRMENAYLKKLKALVQARRPASPKGRK